MESLLESFDSYFYVLINTLPVSIGIGFLFFGVGFLLTNPRVKRLRQQIEHYKDECARMSRSLASINSQHKELIEDLQSKEQEKLLLKTSLESKDEELIGLLDRLNSVAAETDHAETVDGRPEGQEIRNLRFQITELNGKLKTSESALRDRKIELAEARQQLANIGVEAIAGGGSGSNRDHGWLPLPSHGPNETDAAEEPEEEATEEAAVDASGALEIDEGEATAESTETEAVGEPNPPAALEKAADPGESELQGQAEAAPPSPGDLAEPESETLHDIFGEETAELEDQLADFEERLRKKEAEFFALQEQLSFGILEPSPSSGSDSNSAPEPPPATETAASPAAPSPSPNPSFPPLTKASPASPAPFGDATAASDSVAAMAIATMAEQPVIFRGDDPSLWKKSFAGDIVRPADAPDDMKYLRLRREDTGQSVIIRLGKKGLLAVAPSENIIGWNGKGETFEGSHHLGIFDHSLPQEVETRFGAGGWGFGHFYGKGEGQAYCWDGIAIAKTGFEISVLTDLPDSETLRRTDSICLEGPTVPPSEEEDLVFFHSAYPEIWNKNVVDGKGGFALNICRAPRNTRFVKVRRVDNGMAVIIPVTLKKLGEKMEEKKGLGWNGSNEFFFGGHHLGICDPDAANDVEIKYGCGGCGFGHLVDANDQQAFAWGGKAIARTAFEFTAIARDLTDTETQNLLTM